MSDSLANIRVRPVRKRTHGAAGFTLLEVVLAAGLLGFGLLSLFMLHNVAIGSNRHAGRLTTSMRLAQKQMEYLQGLPWPSGNDPSGDLEVTNMDLSTHADPYAFFAHPTGTAGQQPSPVNMLGTTLSGDGPLMYYLTWDVSYPFTDDGTIVQMIVRAVFYNGSTGRLHGVTLSSFKYQDNYANINGG